MNRIADLERLRADWKARFEEAWRAGDAELEEMAAIQLEAVTCELRRALAEIENADL